MDTNGMIGRRDFLRAGICGVAGSGCLFSRETRLELPSQRSLAFHNLHTGENLKCIYWEKGAYVPEALAKINWILRDYRRNEVRAMDIRLLDLLCAMRQELDTHEPFDIVCGYRSPATNEFLREHTDGVAKHSLHMLGMATDIRVPARDVETVRRVAVALRGGGVGTYPRSQFVHVDVGRVRYWKLAELMPRDVSPV
jgi:uncharacterized protein YcbK (DUF882 family)